MNRIFSIYLLILSVAIHAQTLTHPDILIFTEPLTAKQLSNGLYSQTMVDSMVSISHGISIQLSLQKIVSRYPNGKIRYIRYYNKSEPYGTWRYYQHSGQLKFELFIQKNEVFLKEYGFPNNMVRLRKYCSIEHMESSPCLEIIQYPNGQKLSQGKRKPYQQNGTTQLLETGKWVYYFANGKIQSTGKYSHGIKTGKWVFYDQKGHKIRTEKFENGVIVAKKSFSH